MNDDEQEEETTSVLSLEGARKLYPNGVQGTGLARPEQVYEVLRVFLDLGLEPGYLRVDPHGVGVRNGNGVGGGVRPESLVRAAMQLNELRDRKGFSEFAVGLKNPPQFLSTLFEVDCISYTASLPTVGDVEISPEVEIAGKVKRPDFRVVGPGLELFCECKSLASSQRGENSKAIRLSRLIEGELEELVPDGLKVEVAIRKLPRDWNKWLKNKILGVTMAAVQKNEVSRHFHVTYEKSEFWLKLSNLSDPPYFKNCLCVGKKPNGQSKVVLCERQDLTKATRATIKDALTQLPKEADALVHIYGWTGRELEDAALALFADNNYPHLIGIVAWSDRARFVTNPRAVYTSPDTGRTVEAIRRRHEGEAHRRPIPTP